MDSNNSIFVLDVRKRKWFITNNIKVIKNFMETIVVITKYFPQNYLLFRDDGEIDKFETISQELFKIIGKYLNGKNRKSVPDDIRAKSQNHYDWFIKSIKDVVYMPPPGRYQINEYGLIIKTMLSDLEGYATNAIQDYCFKQVN